MYCSQCGTQNDDNNFRCVQCGVVIQAGAPAAGPAQGFNQYAQYPEANKADTALIMGVLGIAICGLFAFYGWYLAKDELRAMDEGRRDPLKRSTAQAAFWLSAIIGVLNLVGIVVGVFVFVAIFAVGM